MSWDVPAGAAVGLAARGPAAVFDIVFYNASLNSHLRIATGCAGRVPAGATGRLAARGAAAAEWPGWRGQVHLIQGVCSGNLVLLRGSPCKHDAARLLCSPILQYLTNSQIIVSVA